jgi:hypothetical protein
MSSPLPLLLLLLLFRDVEHIANAATSADRCVIFFVRQVAIVLKSHIGSYYQVWRSQLEGRNPRMSEIFCARGRP